MPEYLRNGLREQGDEIAHEPLPERWVDLINHLNAREDEQRRSATPPHDRRKPKDRLAGRVVLVVEDEPLVALEVNAALRAVGARVLTAGYLEAGLFTTEHPVLSAAVIDLHLSDGNGTAICRRLHHLGVPFVVHTGYPPMLIRGEWPDVPVISKPARPEQIISALIGLLP